MKQKFLRILSLSLVAVMMLGFAACGDKKETPTTTGASDTTAAPGDSTAAPDGTTAAPDGTTAAPDDNSTTLAPDGSTTTTAPDNTTTTTDSGGSGSGTGQTNPTNPPANQKPETPAEILQAYTTVMNKAKKEMKHYRKLEYQELPKDKIQFESGAISFLLEQAANYVTTKDQAMAKDDYTKGTDSLKWFPIYECSVGCMVTDPGVFDSTKSELLPNGNIKLTLVMKDEKNSEPPKANATNSPSNVGAMFTPLAKAGIDDELNNNTALKVAVRNLEYELTYHKCTATLVYNPANNQLVSVDLTQNVLINIMAGRVLLFNAKGTGELNSVLAVDQVRF